MALGQAGLAVVAKRGRATEPETPDQRVWSFETALDDGTRFAVRLVGPDLPSGLPYDLASPAEIPEDGNWRWTYRLTVWPPIVSLDLCWQKDSGLRVLVFSRGDWEQALIDLAEDTAS